MYFYNAYTRKDGNIVVFIRCSWGDSKKENVAQNVDANAVSGEVTLRQRNEISAYEFTSPG